MCLARERADAALDRVHDLCSKSNTTEGSSYVPLVDEYELVSEFDDLRGVVLRESSDDSDDSADSEHSSDDDTATRTSVALTATAEVIRMRAMALSVFALLRAPQVTNNNGLLSPMRARR